MADYFKNKGHYETHFFLYKLRSVQCGSIGINILSQDEKRDVVSLTRCKGRKYYYPSLLQCIRMFSAPMAVFKGMRKLPGFQNGGPLGSALEMSISD